MFCVDFSYINQEKNDFFSPTYFFSPTNLSGTLYKLIFLFRLWASWYSKQTAWVYVFSTKNGFENASGPKILAKKSQKSKVWFGDRNCGIYWSISQDPMRFLKPWSQADHFEYHEAQNKSILTYKGAHANLSAQKRCVGPKKSFFFKFFPELCV